MRFPRAALYFLLASFIFFIMFVVCTRIMTEIDTGVEPFDDDLGATYEDEMSLIATSFGLISILFFVVGILLVFFLESTSDEYEYYYIPRNRRY